MPTTLADADAAISALWPPAGAEDWDAVGLIAGDPAADTPDHRPVPVDQGGERGLGRGDGAGRLGTPGRKPLQELGVGQAARGPRAVPPPT